MKTPLEIIRVTAHVESRGRYDAWNKKDGTAGISFGLIQFNQKRGSLPDLLVEMQKQDPGAFQVAFSNPSPNKWLDEAWVRSANLNNGVYKLQLVNSATHEPFRTAQLIVARRDYFDPMATTLKEQGRMLARFYSMAFDAAVQIGVVQAKRILSRTRNLPEKEAMRLFAKESDEYVQKRGWNLTRRGDILRSNRFGENETVSFIEVKGSVGSPSSVPVGQGGASSFLENLINSLADFLGGLIDTVSPRKDDK